MFNHVSLRKKIDAFQLLQSVSLGVRRLRIGKKTQNICWSLTIMWFQIICDVGTWAKTQVLNECSRYCGRYQTDCCNVTQWLFVQGLLFILWIQAGLFELHVVNPINLLPRWSQLFFQIMKSACSQMPLKHLLPNLVLSSARRHSETLPNSPPHVNISVNVLSVWAYRDILNL